MASCRQRQRDRIRAFAAVNLPPGVSGPGPGILKGEGMQRGISNKKSISFADGCGPKGEDAHNYNDNSSSEAAGDTGPADPGSMPPDSGGAGEGAALGHAAVARPGGDSEYDSYDLDHWV